MPWVALDYNDSLIQARFLISGAAAAAAAASSKSLFAAPMPMLNYSLQVILGYASLTLNVRSIPTLILIDPKTGTMALSLCEVRLSNQDAHSATHAIFNSLRARHIKSAYFCYKFTGKFTTHGVETIKAGASAFPWRL
jgi:hypothetical protein